jgi:hypothetical protein
VAFDDHVRLSLAANLDDEERSAVLSSPSDRRRHVRDLGAGVAIVAIAVIIGCVGVTRSGPHWVDGPQYANAGDGPRLI